MVKIDKKIFKICYFLNSKVFKVKDMIFGVNVLLMYFWCRSIIVLYVGNWWDRFFIECKGKYWVEDKELVKEKL